MAGDAASPDLIEAMAPFYRGLRRYARLAVTGTEHVPDGKFVAVANHTGWVGLDYAFLCLVLYDDLARFPRVAAHPTWFRAPMLDDLKEKLGMFEVSVTRAAKLLDDGDVVVIFPEAEGGNFKPFWKRHELQEFKPGFARIALAADAPVVPVVIVGGDEANPSLATLPTKTKLGIDLPVPTNVFPLPVKWRMRFLPPVDVTPFLEGDAPDTDAADLLTARVKDLMQHALLEEFEKRGHPFKGGQAPHG